MTLTTRFRSVGLLVVLFVGAASGAQAQPREEARVEILPRTKVERAMETIGVPVVVSTRPLGDVVTTDNRRLTMRLVHVQTGRGGPVVGGVSVESEGEVWAYLDATEPTRLVQVLRDAERITDRPDNWEPGPVLVRSIDELVIRLDHRDATTPLASVLLPRSDRRRFPLAREGYDRLVALLLQADLELRQLVR